MQDDGKVVPFDPKKKRKKDATGGPPERPEKIKGALEDIVDDIKFVRDPSGRLFAVVDKELLPCDGVRFKGRLAYLFHQRTGKDCGDQPIRKVMLRVDGAVAKPGLIPLRYAWGGSNDIWLDLHPGAVRIHASGATLHDESPFAFYHPDGMGEMPRPVLPKGEDEARANLNLLWRLLQFDRRQSIIAYAWLIAAMRPERGLDGHLMRYPLLAVVGSHGSGKTSKVDMLRQLVDPRWPLHTDFPPSLRDFAITAENQRVLAYDNISTITPLVSDGLCRRSTGDGIEIRELYTTRGVTTLAGSNPAVINTIADVVLHAPDLQSRTLLLDLGSEMRRRLTDERVNESFRRVWPLATGALCFFAAQALRDLSKTRNAPSDIRMGAAATWAIASGLFSRSDIIRASRRTQAATDGIALDRPLPAALLEWGRARQGKMWRGGAQQLLSALRAHHLAQSGDGGFDKNSANEFPRNANGLRSALKRLEPVLRRAGIDFDWTAKGSRRFGRNFGISFDNFDLKG